MKMILSPLLLLALVLSSACGKDDSCAQVAKQICDETKLSCDQTRSWLQKQMTGPDDKPLDSAQSETACKMLLGDKEAMAAYREQAKTDLGAAK